MKTNNRRGAIRFRAANLSTVIVLALVLVGSAVNATPVHALAPMAPLDDFVITVKTDNAGTSTSTQFTIPATGGGYNYNVDCDNNGTNEATAQSGDYTCSYGAAGTYTVRIKDNTGLGTGFPRIYFNYGSDRGKLLTIEQWGTGKWTSMASAFSGCANLAGQASDSPDLSGVTDMGGMFSGASAFNQNIGNWNTANVTDLSGMFAYAYTFNQDIGSWNTANVTTMSSMFLNAVAFNQNIGTWNTAKVTDLSWMFQFAFAFNQNIGGWNTAKVTDLSSMFWNARAFNQDIGSWNTASVTDMSAMFYNASTFNQNIGSWNTANVTNMGGMFTGANAFNQNIGSWNTANVTDMNYMFAGTGAFNQDIGSWNTANVTDMGGMFNRAHAFNQNIGSWNTANVTNMGGMFAGATAFNGDIGSWNTAGVTYMSFMFYSGYDRAGAFNQDIGNWNTANVTDMTGMFAYAYTFNQDIGRWNVGALTHAADMFTGVTLSTANYDALLNGWDAQTLQRGVPFNGGNSKYCAGATARSHMISSDLWTITDGGSACPTPTPDCTAKPPKPTLLKPKNNAVVAKPEVKLTWIAATCATKYKVKVINTANGNTVFKETVTLPKTKTGILPDGSYKWFVKACNTFGCRKSTKFTFSK